MTRVYIKHKRYYYDWKGVITRYEYIHGHLKPIRGRTQKYCIIDNKYLLPVKHMYNEIFLDLLLKHPYDRHYIYSVRQIAKKYHVTDATVRSIYYRLKPIYTPHHAPKNLPKRYEYKLDYISPYNSILPASEYLGGQKREGADKKKVLKKGEQAKTQEL